MFLFACIWFCKIGSYLLCSPCYKQNLDLPALASQVLVLQECTTMSSLIVFKLGILWNIKINVLGMQIEPNCIIIYCITYISNKNAFFSYHMNLDLLDWSLFNANFCGVQVLVKQCSIFFLAIFHAKSFSNSRIIPCLTGFSMAELL
jgi:hypothetical protein